MISTISGELQDNIDWVDVVKATFPMGSMTGAPKKKRDGTH
jgi:para-aminobenzoate synthetase component 1